MEALNAESEVEMLPFICTMCGNRNNPFLDAKSTEFPSRHHARYHARTGIVAIRRAAAMGFPPK